MPTPTKARPVIAWPGGKTRLLKHLLPLISEHTLYCEVFGGGLAVFLAKPESTVEVINDINGELISFYRCCKYHLDALEKELEMVLNSRLEFDDYLQQPGLTELQRAARWFVRHKLSFGGMGETFAITRTQPLSSRLNRMLAIRALNQRLDRTTIEHGTWERCFKNYDDQRAFFFLDPPYFDSGGGAYDGWSLDQLTAFARAVRRLKGRWLLTYQDCPEVRALFPDCEILAVIRPNGIGNNGRQRTGRTYAEVIIRPR